MNLHPRRISLVVLLCLLALLAVPIGLTGREVRQECLNHTLIDAVERNDTAAVRNLLHQGADPNAPVLPDDNRSLWRRLWDTLSRRSPHRSGAHATALLLAIRPPEPDSNCRDLDKTAIVQALAAAGANVNVPDETYQGTPLTMAAALDKIQTMRVLVAHHADATALQTGCEPPLTVAAGVADAELVEALLKSGADINLKDDFGRNAICAALDAYSKQNAEKVRKTVACLLRHGVSVEGKDRYGETVVSQASRIGDKQLIQMLKQSRANR